jgi:hypothetical protein
MSFIAMSNNTWKHRTDIPTEDITTPGSNHSISISLSRLLKVSYAHDIRNFSSQYLVVNIRDQDIEIFRVRATNIMNINKITAVSSLFPTFSRKKG